VLQRSNPDLPLVSAIVPAFNSARYIGETLDSLLAQTYPRLEIIVVDDGSMDSTGECVQSYGARVRYFHRPNSGACSAPLNDGIRAATGDLLVFIDADDFMAPHRLAAEVDVLRCHPRVGMVFTDYQDFEAGRILERGHFDTCPRLSRKLENHHDKGAEMVLYPEESTDLLLTENFGSASPMIRREVVAAVGTFDETLKASEDFDFVYRVAAAFPVALIPRIGWYKRLHAASMSSNTPNILRYKILTRRRLLARETRPARRRKLKQLIAQWYWNMAYYQTGRDNRLALRYAIALLRFRPKPDVKLVARIAMDLLGRDTNGERRNARAIRTAWGG
jgi:glycosyltransferase involved in cell wall biosynthesis